MIYISLGVGGWSGIHEAYYTDTAEAKEQRTYLFPPGDSCTYHRRIQRAVGVQENKVFFFIWGYQGRHLKLTRELLKEEEGFTGLGRR